MSQPGLLGPLDRFPPIPRTARQEPLSWAPPWSLPRLWWLNLLLLLLTAVTTTTFGSALATSFALGRPFDQQDLLNSFLQLWRHDWGLARGLLFSGPLLFILFAHEMGHYLTCVKLRVDATLPYFLPSPTLFGTFGAFIRIRTPIYTRRDLFAIGAAGPMAGFIALLPFLLWGISVSRPLTAGHDEAAIIIGTPLALRLLEWVHFGAAGSSHILLHPTATAALAGMLMTALNLLPVGQLDGGHITYAVFGQRGHRLISTAIVALLVVLGKFYWPWWIWAVVWFFLGRRHPLVFDDTAPDRHCRWIAGATLVIFILSVSVVPTRL